MLTETIDAIRAHHRRRCFAMESRKRMDLALGSMIRLVLGWSKALPEDERKAIRDRAAALIKAGEREAKGKPPETDDPEYEGLKDIILASIEARAPFAAMEANALAEMGHLAKSLPVWEWAEPVRGFGAGSLGVIVAEAGDLAEYPKKGHLWKRMGVGVVDGVRQGGLRKTASAAEWIAHGYNRQRRSRMWNIGDALIKSNGDGEYRAWYLHRKEFERRKAEAAGLTVLPSADIAKRVKAGARAADFMSDGHIHKRAQRDMEKRLLRNLWQAWRRADKSTPERALETLPVAAE